MRRGIQGRAQPAHPTAEATTGEGRDPRLRGVLMAPGDPQAAEQGMRRGPGVQERLSRERSHGHR